MTGNEPGDVARALGSRNRHAGGTGPLPSRRAVAELVELARSLLFPHLLMGGEERIEPVLEDLLRRFGKELRRQLGRAIARRPPAERHPDEGPTAAAICAGLIEQLPELQLLLESDVQAAMDGDPALHVVEEAMLCYPGLTAVMSYRVAHALHVLGAPILPRMITAHAHSITAIDIHPGARIGPRFFIDHGSGVVIGATAVIGEGVRLYQGVTLGARSFPVDPQGRVVKGLPRHPIVEDDVVIYSGATILGRVTIGRGAVIGGNVWVTRDVRPGSRVTQATPRQEGFADGGGI
jgi:serine O-acetyltransferase